MPTPPADTTSIMEENWDAPQVKPVPGKPIHNAQQPSRGQLGRRPSPQKSPAARQASQYGNVVGTGVRRANYEQ
jgi:hypothetical protein